MEFLRFLGEHLAASPWSWVVIAVGTAVISLHRLFKHFYAERLAKLEGLLGIEQRFHLHFKTQVGDLAEHAGVELSQAQDRIEELEQRIAASGAAPVPEERAMSMLSWAAKVSTFADDDEAFGRLTTIWGEAGLAVGRQMRWRPWYRPARVGRMFELIAEDAPAPRGRTDAIVFHTIRAAWVATRQFGTFATASLAPRIALDYLTDPSAKSMELTDYIDKVAFPWIDEMSEDVSQRTWIAFKLGASLGLAGKEPEPGEEYVAEPHTDMDPSPA